MKIINDYFADYDAFPDDSIIRILPDGIELSGGGKILFDECARNFRTYSGCTPDTKYIGEKDADDGSFMLYSSPRPVMIKFLPRLFSQLVKRRMKDLENQINEYGYSLTVCERNKKEI